MATKRGILKFIARFFIYTFIVLGIITASILLNLFGPSARLYADDDWEDVTPVNVSALTPIQFNITLDQHSHTLLLEGVLTVRQNIEWHIAMGYNAIVITDHNSIANKAEIDSLKAEYLAKGVVIIQGMEWTTGRIHCNLIGISTWTTAIPSNPTDQDIKDMITAVHDQGGVVTVNHFPWSINQTGTTNHPTRQNVLDWGADFIEIVNDDSSPQYVYDHESDIFCDTNPIGEITGTDMHEPDDLQGFGVSGWTLMNVSSLTEAGIMTELRNQNTTIFSTNGTKFPDPITHPDNPVYFFVRPLSELGGIFINLYESGLSIFSILSYLMYIYLIFAITELYRFGKPKLKEKRQQRKNKRTPEK
jgi:hypothetical protein